MAEMIEDRGSFPKCSILLGTGEEAGLFSGILSTAGAIHPVEQMNIVGSGMRRLSAVDFRQLRERPVNPEDSERWGRFIGALGGADVWRRLRFLRYCVIGAGRTGSLAASMLARH